MRRVFSLSYAFPLLLPLLALLPTLMIPTTAYAARLRLEPVEILGYQGDDLRLSVDLSCGATFYGLLTRLDHKSKLRIAAVVEQEAIVCTSLPDARELVVNFLATRGVAAIAPMSVSEMNNRVQIAPVTSIQSTGRKQGASLLKVAYEPRCGESLGTVVRQTGPRRIEIGMAERPYALGEMASCQPRSRVAVIKSLSLAPGTRVAALRRTVRGASLSRAYELRMAPVKAGSVKRVGRFGGVSLSYKRACNEAPVGIVLAGDASAPRLGVVVARYPNFHCDQDKDHAPRWTRYANLDLKLPKDADLKAIAAVDPAEGELTIEAPERYARTRRGLDVQFPSGCAPAIGVIYAHDAAGRLAFGILARQESRQQASSCKAGPTEVSWLQPFIGKHVLTQDLVPLRLKG